MIKTSFVIATRNRVQNLVTALDSISQAYSACSFEVIVVDNGSTDETASEVLRRSEIDIRIKYICEPTPGLSRSRNRGVVAAVGEYCAFMDDDAKMPVDYLQTLDACLAKHAPDIAGGPIYPFYCETPPEWFQDAYETRLHQNETGWLAPSAFISASNLVIKTDKLREGFAFNESFGMVGNRSGFGEEVDLLNRLRSKGCTAFYDLSLVMYHLVPVYKMTPLYYALRYFLVGASEATMRKNREVQISEREAESIIALFNNTESLLRAGNEINAFSLFVSSCFDSFYKYGVLVGQSRVKGMPLRLPGYADHVLRALGGRLGFT